MRSLTSEDLVLCSGSVRRAPLVQTIEVAAAAGFQGISVYFDEYQAARKAGISDAQLCAILDDSNIAVAELDGPMRWLPSDTVGPSVGEFLDAAAALRARSVTVLDVSPQEVEGEVPIQALADAFASVCDEAARRELLAHIEYFPFSPISGLTTAMEIVRCADRDNGGVMIDSWHHVRGPDAGTTDLAIARDAVLAVQVSDVAPVAHPDVAYETMHRRRLPGEGVGRLPGLLRAIRELGCTAPVEVEVYSDALARRDPFEVSRRCAETIRSVLAAVNADTTTSLGSL